MSLVRVSTPDLLSMMSPRSQDLHQAGLQQMPSGGIYVSPESKEFQALVENMLTRQRMEAEQRRMSQQSQPTQYPQQPNQQQTPHQQAQGQGHAQHQQQQGQVWQQNTQQRMTEEELRMKVEEMANLIRQQRQQQGREYQFKF